MYLPDHLQGWVGSSIKDTAQISIGTLDADVTGFAPSVTPGVLYLPVVNTIVSAVTNGKDTVVKVLAALAGEDTRLVQLESRLVGLDGDRDRLLGNGRHQGRDTVRGHISVARRSSSGDVGVAGGLAGARSTSGSGGVRILVLSGKTTVLLDVGEGIIHPATVAASISATNITRHQLLLGEGQKVTVLVVVGTFDSTSGRERPARTAVALVLDRGDGTGSNPVNSRREGGDILWTLVDTAVGGASQVRSTSTTDLDCINELRVSQVSELIQTQLVGVLWVGVVGLDQVNVIGEDLKTSNIFGSVLDIDAIGLNVVIELVLVVL